MYIYEITPHFPYISFHNSLYWRRHVTQDLIETLVPDELLRFIWQTQRAGTRTCIWTLVLGNINVLQFSKTNYNNIVYMNLLHCIVFGMSCERARDPNVQSWKSIFVSHLHKRKFSHFQFQFQLRFFILADYILTKLYFRDDLFSNKARSSVSNIVSKDSNFHTRFVLFRSPPPPPTHTLSLRWHTLTVMRGECTREGGGGRVHHY